MPVSCPWHMRAIWTMLGQDSFHEEKLWIKRKYCLFSDSWLRAFGFSLSCVTDSICNHQHLNTRTASAFTSPSPDRGISFTSFAWPLMSIYHPQALGPWAFMISAKSLTILLIPIVNTSKLEGWNRARGEVCKGEVFRVIVVVCTLFRTWSFRLKTYVLKEKKKKVIFWVKTFFFF